MKKLNMRSNKKEKEMMGICELEEDKLSQMVRDFIELDCETFQVDELVDDHNNPTTYLSLKVHTASFFLTSSNNVDFFFSSLSKFPNIFFLIYRIFLRMLVMLKERFLGKSCFIGETWLIIWSLQS